MKPIHIGQVLLVCLIAGSMFTVAKVALVHFPPFFLSSLQFAVSLLVLLPYLKIKRHQIMPVLYVSITGGALTTGLIYWGLQLGNASVIAIVSQLAVPFMVLISIVLFGERINVRRWFGIALSFAGVMIIAFDPTAFKFVLGMTIAAAGVFASCMSTVYQRKLTDVSMLSLIAWTAAFGFPILLAISFLFERNQLQLMKNADLKVWGGVFYIGLIYTTMNYRLFYDVLRKYDVSKVAPWTVMTPIFAILFGVIFLHDPLTLRMLIGAAIAILGILLVTWPDRPSLTIESSVH